MRVRYVPVTEKEWISHFQRGGGFVGTPYQRGAGLGSIFRSIFRAILPVAKTAGRAIGKRALRAGAEIASDVVAGKNLKKTVKKRTKQATADLLNQAAKKLQGGRIGSIKGGKKAKPVKRLKKTTTQLGIVIDGPAPRQRKRR